MLPHSLNINVSNAAILLAVAVIVALVHYAFRHYAFRRRTLRYLRGPPSASWLLGNAMEMRSQHEVGDLEFQWINEFGTAWRTAGCYGSEVLMTADPKALQYIYQTSGYHYPKTADVDQSTMNLFGRGIANAAGERHQRHRKIMTPAFSAAQLRTFLPVFRRSIARLSQKWKDELESESADTKVVNVSKGLARVTLDVVLEAAFDYRLDALENNEDELIKCFDNLFADSLLYPPVYDILFKALWPYIPRPILQYVRYLPGREYRRFRNFQETAKRKARALIQEKTDAVLDEKATRDVLSILVHSNAAEDPRRRLDEDEVLSQMATLILAGHDTTAQSLSWLLYELAARPDDQKRIREEITVARERVSARGDADFSPADMDMLDFMNAAIKEGLRLHPIVPGLVREADRDDVIPLAFPVITRSGEVISKIPVRRGQRIHASICGYNRLRDVWGPDADIFRPTRFMDGSLEGQTSVGVYANVMTFSAGIRGCIGWRFAVIEMQAILVELLENYEFLRVEGVEVERGPAGLMVPLVKDRWAEGSQMPLRISLVKEQPEMA